MHPTGAEDDHEDIFTEYAEKEFWVFTHFLELVLVLAALSGLLVLAPRPLAGGASPRPARHRRADLGFRDLALQAVDGVTLKQSVDARAAASGSEQAARYDDAETVRWIEWGLQSYFRVLLGIAFLLVGAAAVVSRLVPWSPSSSSDCRLPAADAGSPAPQSLAPSRRTPRV